MSKDAAFPSKVPKRAYPTTLNDQLEQLDTDELMSRFAESRSRLSSDPYRPLYHYVNPEGKLNDPNGLCYWQGRYHIFYQAYPPEDPRQHWGHAVSDDLVRWSDLPLAIYPDIEKACFSGSTLVEEDRVIALYDGYLAGLMVAVSSDPLLLNWEKIPGNPVIRAEGSSVHVGQRVLVDGAMTQLDESGRPYRISAPCIWKEEDGYYAISGTYWDGVVLNDCRVVEHLFFSQDLSRWIYVGPFLDTDIFNPPGEDGVTPHFWPIGDNHILVYCSHQRGSQYLLGDYDALNHIFSPFAHGRWNFGPMYHGGIHAPSATPDGEGGVYVIHNMNDGKPTEGWDDLMTLARRLTLRQDNTLGIEPVAAVEELRSDHRSIGETPLPANEEIVMVGVEGNAIELYVEIDPQGAREVCLSVLRSSDGSEHTDIKFLRHGLMPRMRERSQYEEDALVMDTSRSSLLPDVLSRAPEVAPIELGDGEPLKLRVFIDKSVVEVFANGRQCVALRVYPSLKDSVGVSVRAQGRDATLRSLEAWQMKSIWA